MKSVTGLAIAVCFIAALLTGVEVWQQYRGIAITAQKAYDLGYTAGRDSVSTPKACVAWWFGEDAKLRHQQAFQAYCKGVK